MRLTETEGPRFDAAVLRALDVWYGTDRRQMLYPDVEIRVIAQMSSALSAAMTVPDAPPADASAEILTDDGPDR